MLNSVRNSPNVGNLAVHDQKKSNVSSGQTNQVAESDTARDDNSAVSVDLSISEKVSTLAASPQLIWRWLMKFATKSNKDVTLLT